MSEELIKLAAPGDADSASWNGNEYAVQDGIVSVPREAINALLPHGFALPKPRRGNGKGEGA